MRAVFVSERLPHHGGRSVRLVQPRLRERDEHGGDIVLAASFAREVDQGGNHFIAIVKRDVLKKLLWLEVVVKPV